MNVGVIGCGIISEIYLKNLTAMFSGVKAAACADVLPEKSHERADAFGLQAMSVQEMLDTPEIEIVLNLTNPRFHKEISLAALRAGKHVYSEKPFCLSMEDACEILHEAEARGLSVGCAPDTFLGAGLQTAFKALDDGWIGQPAAATVFFTCRGHERWHTNPEFYYQAGGGPHLDMGPYYITALAAALGPAVRVSAMSGRALDQRIISAGPKAGKRIPVEVDTHFGFNIAFENGVLLTGLLSFDIWAARLPFLEIYGTSGTLAFPDPNCFGGPVLLKNSYHEDFTPIPLQNPFSDNSRGLGLAQMARALCRGEKHCASGELAAHVLEILLAVESAARTGETVTLSTRCEKPPKLPYGLMAIEYGF